MKATIKRAILGLMIAVTLILGVGFGTGTIQAAAKPKYSLTVDISKQRVYAYAKDRRGNYTVLVRSMVCSTGKSSTPTPRGTYSISDKSRWYYFRSSNVYAQYMSRFRGPYMLHSVLYRKKDTDTLIQGSVDKLGSRASKGCVRLKVKDAKWIYENCRNGTRVKVQS